MDIDNQIWPPNIYFQEMGENHDVAWYLDPGMDDSDGENVNDNRLFDQKDSRDYNVAAFRRKHIRRGSEGYEVRAIQPEDREAMLREYAR